MKKALILLSVFVLTIFFVWHKVSSNSLSSKKSPSSTIEKKAVSQSEKQTDSIESVFVPYWGIGGNLSASDYRELYYFGITFDENGDLIQDEGFDRLDNYKSSIGNKSSSLVIRLINSEINSKILNSDSAREKVISSSINLLEDGSFDGILLDLEMSGLGFESTERLITGFIKEFSGGVKNKNKKFYTALYGDTYYRGRPYNVEHIAAVSDRIMIMSYDFHKARAKGGPNFPFEKSRDYPYDFQTMIEDFKKDAPPEKIEIVFGMFGYDWGVNDSEIARSYSYNKIKQDFLDKCTKTDCEVKTNLSTREGHVVYTEDDILHDVWFETPESVELKKRFAQDQGIRHFSYWAYSFF